ncbi:MAG: M28 family peptidase [Bacteroidota bacterium]
MKIYLKFILILLSISACQSPPGSTSAYFFEEVRPTYNAQNAMASTAYVEQFWRLPGNSGFDSSIYHVEKILLDAGYVKEAEASPEDRLVYRLETRPMEEMAWEPVSGTVTLVGEETPLLDYATNRNMININSLSTPEEGVEAEVVWVKSLGEVEDLDLEGKIAFVETHPYWAFRAGIFRQGAVGLFTYRLPDYTQPEKHNTSIQFSGIPETEESVFGISLSYSAMTALKAKLEQGTTRVRVILDTKRYESEELTLVAKVRGSQAPEEEFVFSAHVQEPGANDNASGVGCLAESARTAAELLAGGKIDPKRTVTFLWGDEITSTRRYVEEMAEQPIDILWGVSLDMVGQNTDVTGGTFLIEKMPDPSAIWTRGNDQHSEWGGSPMTKEDMFPHFFNDFAIHRTQDEAAATGWVVSENPFEGGSDHVPFLRGDIPGLLFWHFTDVFYHTDNDRIDKVSPETMKHVGVSSLVTALTLTSADQATALAICEETKLAALERLTAEQVESQKALADTSTLAYETDIIMTWKEWYVEALQTVETVELAGPSAEVAEAIKASQEAVEARAKEVLAILEE